MENQNTRPYQNIWGKVIIGEGSKIAAFVEIGHGVVIGRNCKIEAFAFIPPGVLIGNNVFVGPHVCFTNDRHPMVDNPHFMPEPTVVMDGASIGANATILPGITIGKGAMVGAGAVVTHDVPEGRTVVGNPAHLIFKVEDFAPANVGGGVAVAHQSNVDEHHE